MKTIGVIGYGWLGKHLADFFSDAYQIVATTTTKEKFENISEQKFTPILVNFDAENQENLIPDNQIQNCDILIICIPFSRNINAEKLLKRFKNLSTYLGNFQKQIFLMSTTGIYPQMEMIIQENTLSDEKLFQNYLNIEKLMQQHFPQINILRLGGLMGGTRKFSNYAVSDTEQPVNHIHFQDISSIINEMISKNLSSKTYNVVAPQHPSKQAIIDYQLKGIKPTTEIENMKGRIISPEKLIQELEYQFVHPNPIFF